MIHHSSSVNGEGTSCKDPLSRILDELRSLKLWKEQLERKVKGKEGVEISQDESKQIREEERRKKKKKKEIVTEKERMHRFNWKLNEMSYQFSALKR